MLGRAALHHLLCIEQIAKAIRSARLAADRAASEAAERQRETAAAGRRGDAKGQQQQRLDDIGALLGVGSVAADAELDALAEMLEAKVSLRWDVGDQNPLLLCSIILAGSRLWCGCHALFSTGAGQHHKPCNENYTATGCLKSLHGMDMTDDIQGPLLVVQYHDFKPAQAHDLLNI